MNKLRCLIVDDEPIARQIVEGYVREHPLLESAGVAGTAMEAKLLLQQQAVDILFLDINMPVLDGIGFLRTLKHPPQVIFTTAYKEYAVDAFDLAATDYLLKPFSFERFVMAIDKAADRIRQPSQQEPAPVKSGDAIFIKSENKLYNVSFNDILYLEAYGNYTKVYTRQRLLMPAATFNSLEVALPTGAFIRTHRSFIINRGHINHIEGNRVFIAGHEIPIGSTFREDFYRRLGID